MKEEVLNSVSECAETRLDIENLQLEFRDLGEAFKGLTAHTRRAFKNASNVIYYQGGWPSADTPPRYQTLAHGLVETLAVLRLVGASQFERYLNDLGVTFEPKSPVGVRVTKSLEESLANSRVSYTDAPEDAEEGCRWLMARAQGVQKRVCELSDKVKDEAATVEEAHGVSRTAFMRAVGAKKLELSKGRSDMVVKIDEVLEQIEATDELLRSVRDR